MKRILLTLAVCLAAAQAETRTLTLAQAVDLALRQNPDLALARLDEQKAALEVRAMGEPLLPRVYVGSGLAYSNGYPMSIDGSAPSMFQARAVRNLYDAKQSQDVAAARQSARGAAISSAQLREEVALRTATLYLDLERTVRALEVVLRQKENLDRVEAAVRLRVAEGREIPLEGKRAALNSARARQRIAMLEDQRTLLGRALASVAGLGGDVLVAPAGEERTVPVLPASEDASAQAAVENSRAIQKLESDVMVKGFEARGFRAAHKPRISLVAQYGLFAKYNHYEDYFQRFTRHNGQLGVSIEVPVFVGTLHDARAAQADIDARRLRAQLLQARLQISADARGAWTKLREAETADEIARMDLDIAREAVSVRLAETEAGRAGLRQVEEARFLENEKWLAFYDAHYALERCRLELLKQAGTLGAALR